MVCGALQSFHLYHLLTYETRKTDKYTTEATPKSGAAIVKKTWAERLNDQPELESDADEQLLMHVP